MPRTELLGMSRSRGAYHVSAGPFRLWHAGYLAPVGDGISELHIHNVLGRRIYFHQCGDTVIILLYGRNKSWQNKDIMMSRRLVDEWNN
jgi:putative addiction module killer protein